MAQKNINKGINAPKNLLLDETLYAKKANDKLNGPALVYDIISKSEFVTDPLNGRFEIDKGWYEKPIDERSAIISFIKNSGH
jgi:hypothetical protein